MADGNSRAAVQSEKAKFKNAAAAAGIRYTERRSFTGIDIDHPDFGGTGANGTTPFPSARVTHGWDFVGDTFNADPDSPGYNPVATPDPNPDDCAGHGTHVAGIIGANGTVKGVAPSVTFGWTSPMITIARP